jgi:lipopolysaccharide export system permease protein
MSTLDRYIARQYLFNIVALLVLLFSFVVAIDVALNIDKFLSNAEKVAGKDAGAVRRIAIAAVGVVDFWWPLLLQLFSYMVGLVLVAAMGFTLTQMVRHREMVAVLASGISLYRLARPILIVAALVLALKIINQEFVLSRPSIAALLARDKDGIGSRDWSKFPVRLVPDSKNRLFFASDFDPVKGEMTDVHIWERDGAGGVQGVISAESAQWQAGGWTLANPKLQSMGLATSGSPALSGAGTPPTRIQTDLDPATLKFLNFREFSQTLSWSQIGEMLSSPLIKPDMAEKLQRTRYSRLSQTLATLLALIITMPFYMIREPKNMLVQTLKCAPVGIVSLMGGVLLSLYPWPGLPPGFAVFIPVLVLCPVAVAMVSWLRT